jgi:hypothetical protein
MDNVQNCDSYINIRLPQTYRSYETEDDEMPAQIERISRKGLIKRRRNKEFIRNEYNYRRH